MSSHCDIINLPIEILDLVYKYISVMRDKLNLAKSHCVLEEAFAFHSRNIFKEIEIGDRPIEDWSGILSLCGSSVTSIRAEYIRNSLSAAKLASMHCPNLEKFSFPFLSSSWNQFQSLLLTLQNLSCIEIWNCSENVSVVDALLQMPKLKHLKLSGNYHDLERLGELSNLTKLNLSNHGEPIDIFKVCSPLKNIISLELENFVFRMPKDLGGETLWPKIELLKANYGYFHTPLPYLPTLKNLTIEKMDNYDRNSLYYVLGESVFSYGKTLESMSYYRYFTIKDYEIEIIMKLKALKKLEFKVGSDDCLQNICKLENLEELNLASSEITNSGVIEVINRSKKLRHLNICECVKVNSDMLKEAVAALQHFPRKSNKPFVLCVSPSFGDVDKSKLGGVLNIEYIKHDFNWWI